MFEIYALLTIPCCRNWISFFKKSLKDIFFSKSSSTWISDSASADNSFSFYSLRIELELHAFSNNSQFYDETQGPFSEKIELTFYE